jgi:hypothetical protein
VAPAVNVTSALIDRGFWLVAAVLFQLGIIRVSLLASTLVGSWIVDVQRCADAQPHGQIGVCDKFAAERDEVAQAFAKPVRCALGVEAVYRRGVPTPIGTLLMHLAVEGSPLGTLIHTLTASRCNRELADCVRSSPEQSGEPPFVKLLLLPSGR